MNKTFAMLRKRLEAQYLDVKYDASSGLPPEMLELELERYLHEHPGMPRILIRAWLFSLLTSKALLAVDPDDCFADRLHHGNLMIKLRNKWKTEESARRLADVETSISEAYQAGAYSSELDLSHTSPDWENILKLGLTGLRDRALARADDFHKAVAMVYDGAINLVKRLTSYESRASKALSRIAEGPPRTFHEALQLTYIYHELQEMEGEQVRAMGPFDRLYIDFYRNDIDAGRLTREQAKELLKFFWIKFYARTQGKKFGKNFLFGPDINELSCLGIETYQEMHTVDPKLSIRISRNTPNVFLEQVGRCIRSGSTGIVMDCEELMLEMLSRNGKNQEDIRNYVLIGCYEPAIMGKEMCCSMATRLNLSKSIELVMNNGTDPLSRFKIGIETGNADDFGTFEEFKNAYYRQLEYQIERAIHHTKKYEECWPESNPSPFLSGTMDECLAKGLDVSQGGAKYNSTGFMCGIAANAVDSLEAVRQLVFEKNICTMRELRTALLNDWQGHEKLRLTAMNKVSKWGNNSSAVDALMIELTEFISERINREANTRDGRFQAGLFSINHNHSYGKSTGALPDGRKAHRPLAQNTGAMTSMDKNGVTALINSVSKINFTKFPDGAVLDIMLHPTSVSGEDGLQALIALIRTYFGQGGMAIQFNIFDAETLRKAQDSPEEYASLQVRVCGWNVRFVDLSRAEQEVFIASAETGDHENENH